MDYLSNLGVFVAVAEERGFAPAARRLSLSPPAVTRAIAAVEQRLGARLFRRTTRRVKLTEAGERFLGDAKRVLTELEEAEASLRGSHQKPHGTLSITASVLFGRLFVAPIVLEFLERHRQVSVRLLLLDRVVDLVEEGLDLAVRIAHLPDSAMSAVRVGSVRHLVCASPKYLAKHGTPKTPDALLEHEAVAFASGSTLTPRWRFMTKTGAHSITPKVRLTVNAADVAIAAAVGGAGVTRALSYQIAAEVRSGKLRVLLAEYEPPPVPIHLVHREGQKASATLRAFIDFARERLRADVSLDSPARP